MSTAAFLTFALIIGIGAGFLLGAAFVSGGRR